MNVARKSTAKLPQGWQPVAKAKENKNEEADSGVGSADSVDFQDALDNLKALSGTDVENDRSELKDLQTSGLKQETTSADAILLSSAQNGDDKDILDQIDDIVNDKKLHETNGASEEKVKIEQDSDEDDVLILNVDEQSESKKDIKMLNVTDSKEKATAGSGACTKNSLKLGEKVRSTVHNIMSKFVQNNPAASSLLAKVKSEDSADSGGSGVGSRTASPLPIRQNKGNLFDNILETDVTSPTTAVGNSCKSPSNGFEDSTATTVKQEADAATRTETGSSTETIQTPDDGHVDPTSEDITDKETESNSVDTQKASDAPFDIRSDSSIIKLTEEDTASASVSPVNDAREDEGPTKDTAPQSNTAEENMSVEADPPTNSEICNKCNDTSESDKILIDPQKDSIVEGDSGATQEEKMETTDVDVCDKLTSDSQEQDQSSDRKRQHSQDSVGPDGDAGENSNSMPPLKRSRLDGLIGKLGERVTFTSEDPVNETFEDEEDDSTPADTDSMDKQSEIEDDCVEKQSEIEDDSVEKQSEIEDDSVEKQSEIGEDTVEKQSELENADEKQSELQDTVDKQSELEGAVDKQSKLEEDTVNKQSEVEEDTVDKQSELEKDTVEKQSELEDTVDKQSELEEDTVDKQSELEEDTVDKQSELEEDTVDKQSELEDDTVDKQSELEEDTVDKQSELEEDTVDKQSELEEDTVDKQSEVEEDLSLKQSEVEEDSAPLPSEEPVDDNMSDVEEEPTLTANSDGKITLSRKELEKIIVAAATAAIKRHHSEEVLNLNRRIEEIRQSQNEWRTKAKELQSKMLDLTVLQQKLDKRKAHAAALKSITTRSVGVGVTEDRLRTTTPQKMSGNKTPPATPPATNHVPSLVPLAQAAQQRAQAPHQTTQSIAARNTSVAHLLSQTARMPTVESCQAAKAAAAKSIDTSGRLPVGIPLNPIRGVNPSSATSSSVVLVNSTTGLPVVNKVAQQPSRSAPAGAARDLIDLTVEEDAGAGKQQVKQVLGPGQRMVSSQQLVKQIPPLSQGVPMVAASSAILFSTSGGTQIMGTNSVPRQGMLQVVTLAGTSGLRPGQYVTVVPGQSGPTLRPTTALTSTNTSAPRLVTQQLPGGMRLMSPAALNNVRVSVPTAPSASARLATASSISAMHTAVTTSRAQHPAALPLAVCPRVLPPNAKPAPPKPGLKISRVKQGIVLSWNMTIPSNCVEISTYQLYAYQESGTMPLTSLWKKVGDVNALALPMACTLTQFQDGHKYHFAVRAIDIYGRSGPFSDPAFIHLTKLS